MELDTILKILNNGDIGVLALMGYFIWKLDREVSNLLAEIRAQQESRDAKLNSIHSDIGAMIRKLAGMNGSNQ